MISDPDLRDFLRGFYEENCVHLKDSEEADTALLRDSVELLASQLRERLSTSDELGDFLLAPKVRELDFMLRRIKNPVDAKRAIEAATIMVALIVKAQNVSV
jgi:hypothetical protein